MTQNKATSDDDIVSILECVDENLESSDSDNETGDNQESDYKGGISNSEQSDRKAAPSWLANFRTISCILGQLLPHSHCRIHRENGYLHTR
jgi:hypothetical protein